MSCTTLTGDINTLSSVIWKLVLRRPDRKPPDEMKDIVGQTVTVLFFPELDQNSRKRQHLSLRL